MKKRTLFIHSSDELYGADRVLLDILRSLPDEERAQAVVWLPSDLVHAAFPLCEALNDLGIENHHVPLPILRRANLTPKGMLDLARRSAAFRRAVARVQPEMIYGTTSATLPALVSVSDRGYRLVLHNQEVWAHSESLILGQAARCADSIVAISQATLDAEPAYLHARTTIVPNTTTDQELLDAYRPLSTVPEAPLMFAAAGRWTANKGFDVLLDAWAINAPGELKIAGSAPDSGPGLDLHQQLSTNPHAASVELLGQVDSIDQLINSSHVMVMPSSWQEPFGLVALEAMSAGRPVVATRVGGLQAVVDDEVGWLVEPNNPEQLAEVLASITLGELAKRGANARRRYENLYSLEQFRHNWRAAVLPPHAAPAR